MQAHRVGELAHADSVGRAVRTCDLRASVSRALGAARSYSSSAACRQTVSGRRECTHWASRTSHVGETESFQTSGELWSDALCEGDADAAIGPCSLHTPTARRRWCEKAVQSGCASHAAEHHGSVTCAIASGRCKEVRSNEAANPRHCGQRTTPNLPPMHCPNKPPMHLSYCTTSAYPLTKTPAHTPRVPHSTTP